MLNSRAGASLHFLVDQDHGSLLTVIGEERCAEGEALNLAAHTTALAHRPNFGNVERHARDGPAKLGSIRLEHGGERLARVLSGHHMLYRSDR